MKASHIPVLLTLACAIAGCATLEHQTTQTEPHAVIRFTKPAVTSTNSRSVKLLDGAPPGRDKDYRITPGGHELVIEVTESSTEASRPFVMGSGGPGSGVGTVDISQDGRVSSSGLNPMVPMQPVNLRVDSRRTRSMTQRINVEAGWQYEHDGTSLRKTTRLP